MKKLSHYTESGSVKMVDVSAKSLTTRTAVAHGLVKMSPSVVRAVKRLRNPKGNPLEIARIAGIAAARSDGMRQIHHPGSYIWPGASE